MQPPAAIDRLSELFGLSPFERQPLLLCAGVEMDSRWPRYAARPRRTRQRATPPSGWHGDLRRTALGRVDARPAPCAVYA